MKLALSLIALVFALPAVSHAKINAELGKYLKLTQTMNEQLVILKQAGKCGNIGSRVADSMDKGINDLKDEKNKVTEATQKKAKDALKEVASNADENFHRIDRHKGMVLWGLDGDKPECKTAIQAFTKLHDLTAMIPDQVRKISASL